MSILEKFMEQRTVFEAAYDDGSWSELKPYFSSDTRYEIINMPFHCDLRGRDKVIAGLKWSTDRFDKLCTREIGTGGRFVALEGNKVLVHTGIRFTRAESPAIETRLWEIATFNGGLIEHLVDIYDAGASEVFKSWMAEYGDGLDPSYEAPSDFKV